MIRVTCIFLIFCVYYREVNEEFLEFECPLKLEFRILMSPGVLYKYCVYGVDHPDESEYLHDAPRGWRDRVLNRCLTVKKEPRNSKNCFTRTY